MTRLGLTQRVDVVESYGERRDCLDQAWTTLLEEWGYQPVPLPNTVDNPDAYLEAMSLDGLILTSGNDLANLEDPDQPAPERDRFERAALDWASEHTIPVLGVCRGLELINDYFGGTLSTVEEHVAIDHPVTFNTDTLELTQNTDLTLPEEITANSYHDYGLNPADVADELIPLATAPDGTIEALAHPDYPLVGIMWHPERETNSTEFDRKLFEAMFTPMDQ